MPSEQFIGRVPELASIPELLYPDRQTQHRVQIERPCLVLSGPGGIGKTQIAITYARTPRQSYQSVLWMDASSKATLKGCFQSVSGIIFGHKLSQPLDSTESVTRTIEWLSDSNNTRWLLIFDSYDHRGEFELEKYYPPVAHGAIIVTTRRPDVVHRKTATLEIKPLPNADSFIILQSRSKRENIEIGRGQRV